MRRPEEILENCVDAHDDKKHWASGSKEGQCCYACSVEAIKIAALEGLEEGLRMYAHWKDGVEYVGTCGTTLNQALDNIRKKYK